MPVHPTAIVDPAARLGAGVEVGPFCLVGPDVVLGPGVRLRSHVVVEGDTEIGEGTEVWPFAVLGAAPQDLKYAGERTSLRIGARNRIREHVTMHLGTAGGGGVTRVGSDGLFMAGVHVAHDVQVGDRVVVANASGIAGHAVIGDDVIIGGLSGVHQWVRVGQGAIIGSNTVARRDVIPYGLVQGVDGTLEGLNLVGLRRRGVPRDDIAALRRAFDALASGEGSFHERAAALDASSPAVREVVAFIQGATERQFLTPQAGPRAP